MYAETESSSTSKNDDEENDGDFEEDELSELEKCKRKSR